MQNKIYSEGNWKSFHVLDRKIELNLFSSFYYSFIINKYFQCFKLKVFWGYKNGVGA